MMSFRFVPVVCVLVALALVPTLLHSYSDPVTTDGRTAANVDDVLGALASVQTKRSATWGQRRFGSDDWIERTYVDGETGERLQLTVVRSFDAKSVYHHPELAVADGISFRTLETQIFPQRPEVPVHVLRPSPGVAATAMYALHYDGRFIDSPIWFQLRTAGELLFSRRKPMTLFFVLATDTRGDVEQDASQLLFAAIESFLAD